MQKTLIEILEKRLATLQSVPEEKQDLFKIAMLKIRIFDLKNKK